MSAETIPEIVALIEELIAAGHAYESGGDVYFRVASFETYGALSGQRPDEVEMPAEAWVFSGGDFAGAAGTVTGGTGAGGGGLGAVLQPCRDSSTSHTAGKQDTRAPFTGRC